MVVGLNKSCIKDTVVRQDLKPEYTINGKKYVSGKNLGPCTIEPVGDACVGGQYELGCLTNLVQNTSGNTLPFTSLVKCKRACPVGKSKEHFSLSDAKDDVSAPSSLNIVLLIIVILAFICHLYKKHHA